uniref:Putative secreted protein n=1 Tax=Panstrongylus lignarius TaxID=156445 RepID=A0A224XU47_9HEMI
MEFLSQLKLIKMLLSMKLSWISGRKPLNFLFIGCCKMHQPTYSAVLTAWPRKRIYWMNQDDLVMFDHLLQPLNWPNERVIPQKICSMYRSVILSAKVFMSLMLKRIQR